MSDSIFGKIKKIFSSGNVSVDANRNYRASRVQIHAINKIHFLLNHPPSPEKIKLANISSQGIGFIRDPAVNWPPVGTSIRGTVRFESQVHPIEAKIMHLSDEVVGCKLLSESEDLKNTIEKYFELELAAINLTEVNREILKEETRGVPHLFRGNYCELYFVENDFNVTRFQLSFFGNYIEGGEGMKPKFGYLSGGDKEFKVKHKATSLVRLVSGLPEEIISSAEKFVLNIPGLDSKYKKKIAEALKS